MVDEVEPVVVGAEDRERGEVLLAPDGDDVVAGSEPAERVPLRRLVGVAGGRSGEHGAHGRTRACEQEVAGTHRGVVEVRREHEDSVEGVGREHAPREAVVGHQRRSLQSAGMGCSTRMNTPSARAVTTSPALMVPTVNTLRPSVRSTQASNVSSWPIGVGRS